MSTVAIRPVTPLLARTHDLPTGAEWAVVAITEYGVDVLDTDVDQRHLLTAAMALAFELGARLVEPEATCRRCSRPVPVTDVYCQPRPGRNCAAEDASGAPRDWSLLDVKPTGPAPLAYVTTMHVPWAVA